MARRIGRLNALAVSRTKKPGMYADGGGLYLQVGASGVKSWIYRFMLHGRARYMGLGALHAVSLAEARDRAEAARRQRRDGIDPIEANRAEHAAARFDAAKAITFRQAAADYIAANAPGWSNAKHSAQWEATLTAYAFPVFGNLSVQAIDTGLVLKAIEPIWATKTETASRVRGRIESVLDWATTRGYRTGDNPARWRGHLDKTLPKRSKVQRVRHFSALPYAEIGAFMAKLRARDGTAARALEFLILTAARTSEVTGGTWGEISLDEAVWARPAPRIKSRRDHRVPLSQAALAVLAAVKGDAEPAATDWVFPGGRRGKPLSSNALRALLERMRRTDVAPHGFRSSFRDWTAEHTNFPREVAEAALAHAVPDKVEAAYRRGDFFAKRRQLMDAWARYCATPATSGDVVAMRRRKGR